MGVRGKEGAQRFSTDYDLLDNEVKMRASPFDLVINDESRSIL